jgi:cell division protein FtsQ
MSARIARGNVRQKPRGSAGRGRKPAKAGLAEQLGLQPETIGRLLRWALLILLAGAVVAAAAVFRVPQTVGVFISNRIGDAGFVARRIEVRGHSRLNAMNVYSIAIDQVDRPMPLVDLDETRSRLLRLGWVADARVSRRLPDTLVVDIVERQPVAIWQNQQRLFLIDASGVVLERVRLEAMPDLPLVIGPGANLQSGPLNRLLEAVPHLRPQLAGATWIGGRRWDLRFQSGEILALPEGEQASHRALVHFARMDQYTQLLGRGWARFDMRDARNPTRIVARISREPGRRVSDFTAPAPAQAPNAPAGAAPDLSNTI